MPTITDVANFFRVQLSKSDGSSLTHLKLQKLAYYAQAWCLAIHGRRLCNAEFEAWAHGPVNRSLYSIYRNSGWQNIEALDEDKMACQLEEKFNEDELILLNDVWEVYGDYDAKYLERLTHQELPWIEARDGLPLGAYCETVISEETMRSFYADMLQDATK